ncbi:MAG: hypothetical protein KA206_05130, partial [Paludibacter sp.]|nr:hypothetical protein [Paludibacter sp.]
TQRCYSERDFEEIDALIKRASGGKAAVWVRYRSGVLPYFGSTRTDSPTRGTRGTPKILDLINLKILENEKTNLCIGCNGFGIGWV